jgi:hypothetical protein
LLCVINENTGRDPYRIETVLIKRNGPTENNFRILHECEELGYFPCYDNSWEKISDVLLHLEYLIVQFSKYKGKWPEKASENVPAE